MVGLYVNSALKVTVEMSMPGNDSSAPALLSCVSNILVRTLSRYSTLRSAPS